MEKNLCYEKDFIEFCKGLELCFNQYVDEVKTVVLQHIEELYSDKTIVEIVREYKKEFESTEKLNNNWLLTACRYDYNNITTCNPIFNYSHTLYYLCYKRYTKNKE